MREDLLEFLREHKMPTPAELGASPTRILIVDEEPSVTLAIGQAIRQAHPDYEVMEAHDCLSAGAIVATVKPEVVVVDIGMPGVEMCDVRKVVESRDGGGHTSVIAVATDLSDEDRERIMRCGVSACLEKPADMDVLLREVDACIAAERSD